MSPAPLLLGLLVAASPIILVFDGPLAQALVMAASVLCITIVALRARTGDADFLSPVIVPVAAVAAIPAICMVLQILPAFNLANPIWKSAADALGRPLVGRISIDPGATFAALGRYLSAIAILLTASAIAVERRRAEWLLFSLTAATTAVAIMAFATSFDRFTIPGLNIGGIARAAAADCASLGIVLGIAAIFRLTERSKPRSVIGSRLALLTWLIAVAICCAAVFRCAANQTYLAVVCGVATFATTMAIRRFRIQPWGYSAIVSLALVIIVGTVFYLFNKKTMDVTLAFADYASPSLIAVTKSMLRETSLLGSGAGTFASLVPIFRDINELNANSAAPTAVSAVAVEMGRPFLLAMLAATVALIVTLLRGALRRGRDSFYSAAGASCVTIVLLLAFGNSGVFSTSVMLVGSVALGIAIAQSKSRSA
jgi:hypothetical protein